MLYPILGFFFISIFGTLAHFLYDWTNHNKISAIFFAVNESTWEHIKMGLSASFLWNAIEIFKYHGNTNFLLAILIETLSIIIIILALFYGYKLITKKSILAFDISIFFIAIGVSQYLFYVITKAKAITDSINLISLILLILIFLGYLAFTIHPLKNKIFKDPITKEYGLKAHK